MNSSVLSLFKHLRTFEGCYNRFLLVNTHSNRFVYRLSSVLSCRRCQTDAGSKPIAEEDEVDFRPDQSISRNTYQPETVQFTQTRPRFKSTLPQSIVSLRVSNNYLNWLHLSSSYEVLDWQSRELFDFTSKRNFYNQLPLNCFNLVKQISHGDAYLFEFSHFNDWKNPSAVRMKMNNETLTNTLEIMLNYRQTISGNASNIDETIEDRLQEWSNCTYRCPTSVASTLFKCNVGGTFVDPSAVCKEILNGTYSELPRNIHVPSAIMESYRRLNKDEQYFANRCLLQALTFYMSCKSSEKSK